MDEKLKHFEFIQAAIQRLSSYSFAYKGWAITTVGATLALSGHERRAAALIVLLPIASFALLDAFYLRQERLFRFLYDAVISETSVTFSMDVSPYAKSVPATVCLLFTPAIALLYGTLIALTAIVWLWS